MNFGMGLVLSFTDNATAGINNTANSLTRLTQIAEDASSSLNQMASLSALSVVASQVGDSFTSMGSTILSTLGQVIGKVNETGQTLMYAERQLDKLYEGSGMTGADVVSQIQDYAKSSIFEFENLISVVTQLKSVGIEAFDSIASSSGQLYDVMTLASDLAAFNPNMRNVYGTGIEASMGALKEYIAEGNALSLKRGAGLDITSILGEDKGATMEERARQVADLIEQLGMVGMTASLAESPMTKLSNMSDTLFQFLGMVSNSGVYNQFNALITKFADYVMAIPDEELQTIATTVGSALVSILKPLEKGIDKLLSFVDVLRKLVANNPKLVKFATVGGAVAGVLLILAGVALKATSAMSGLSLMFLASGKTFSSLGGLFKAGIAKILGVLLPFIAIASVMYLAWKTDFAGIRTMTTTFVGNLVTSFTTAKNAVSGSVEDMVSTIDELRQKGDFFSNFTLSVMKVMQVVKSVAEAWNTNTLSEDNYQKAKELGVLPLIESILDLKYRFDFFKKGFIDGWKSIGDKVQTFISGFADKFDGTIFQSVIDGIADFLEKLSSGDTDAWYEFGQKFAEFTANAVAFVAVLKILNGTLGLVLKVVGIFSAFGKIGGFIVRLIGGIGKMFPLLTKAGGALLAFGGKVAFAISAVIGKAATIGEAFAYLFPTLAKIGSFFVNVFSKIGGAIKAFIAFMGTTVGGIIAVVVGAVTAVLSFFSMLKDGFSWVKEILMIVGIALTAIGAIILGAPALVAGIIAGIVAGIATLVVVIKDNWEKIKSWFAGVGEFFAGVGTKIGEFFADAFRGVINWVLESIVNRINGFIKAINFAIGVINAIPGVSISKINLLEVPELAQGGVVDRPTYAMIGEAGQEAVVPLENNTEWTGQVASLLSSALRDKMQSTKDYSVLTSVITSCVQAMNHLAGVISSVNTEVTPTEVRPISNQRTTNMSRNNTSSYMTSNNNNTSYQGDTDNSVTFEAGSIVIHTNGASDAEAVKMAKKIMAYIKRQKELDDMLAYS